MTSSQLFLTAEEASNAVVLAGAQALHVAQSWAYMLSMVRCIGW
jgi:hypothetical protein